jgi:hypothetical protein
MRVSPASPALAPAMRRARNAPWGLQRLASHRASERDGIRLGKVGPTATLRRCQPDIPSASPSP